MRINPVLWWVIAIAIVLGTVASASASGDEKYVTLVDNTNFCAPNSCHTTYRVCAIDWKQDIDWYTAGFGFRSTKEESIKSDADVTQLKTWEILVNNSEHVIGECRDKDNKLQPCEYDAQYFEPLNLVAGKTLQVGECADIRIQGSIDAHSAVDNVFSLKVNGFTESYTQWAVWNATDTVGIWNFDQYYTDSSGHNNLLRTGGSPVFNTTSFIQGNASLQQVGASSAYNSTPAAMPTGSESWTMSTWVYLPVQIGAGTQYFLEGFGNTGTGNQQIAMDYYEDIGTYYLRLSNFGGGSNTHAQTIGTAGWHNIILTFSGNNSYRIYYDNNSIGDGALGWTLNTCGGVNDATCEIVYGARTWNHGTLNWPGSVDRAEVWNFVLNSTQVAHIYNNSKGDAYTNKDCDPLVDGCPPTAPVPGAVYFASANANGTVNEMSVQSFALNVTFNTTAIADVNATLVWDSTSRTVTESTVTNGTGWNNTKFSSSFQIPFSTTNASNHGYYWSYYLGYTNGSSLNINTTNLSTTVLWTYFISTIQLAPANITEGQTAYWNATITGDNVSSYVNGLNFTYNRTVYVGTLSTNTTTSQLWTGSLALPANNPNNFSAGLNASFSINGSNRNSTTTPTLTVWKMILTDCSVGSASTVPALRYDLFDEVNNTFRVSTTSVQLHTFFTTGAFNRTYSSTLVGANNWTVCIYPYYSTSAFSDAQVVQSGDGIIYGIRTLSSTLVLNVSQQNISIYLLNASELGVALVTVNVQDQNGIALPNYGVEIYRYYLDPPGTIKVAQDVTDSVGRIKTYLVQNTVYYQFKVYSDTGFTHNVLTTGLMRIYDASITLKIGSVIPKYLDIYSSLSKAVAELNFINATKQFQLHYDLSTVFAPNSTYSVNAVCLRTEYAGNGSSTDPNLWVLQSETCSTVKTGTLTGSVVTEAVAIDWRAWAYANISASPDEPYLLAIAAYSFISPLAGVGLFWAVITALTVGILGLWNPVVFVTLVIFALSVMAWVGLISGFVPLIVTGIVMTMVLARYLRS